MENTVKSETSQTETSAFFLPIGGYGVGTSLEEVQSKPKKQPPYGVWLLNDDKHSLEYVCALVKKVFKYEDQKVITLVLEAHKQGESLLWVGTLEHAEAKKDAMTTAVPEVIAGKKIGPVGVDLRPTE